MARLRASERMNVALTVMVAFAALAKSQSPIEFDHLWIMVSPGGPERAALEHSGLQISPKVNRHDGQGTASITVEFENAFLELMWPDSTVPISAGLERAVEKFKQRMLWRTSGWCPVGLGFRRLGQTNDALPFPTWSVTPPWLPAGSAIEMLTPREDTKSPSLFISPRALADPDEQNARAARFHHPIGVRRITAVRLLSPKTYQPIEPLRYLQKLHLLEVATGDEWLAEVTLDQRKRKQSRDLRPDLPLVIRY